MSSVALDELYSKSLPLKTAAEKVPVLAFLEISVSHDSQQGHGGDIESNEKTLDFILKTQTNI